MGNCNGQCSNFNWKYMCNKGNEMKKRVKGKEK